MTSQQILQADLLDIVFEQRNKSYGAYQLRKLYPKQLTKALLCTVCAVLLLLFFFKPSGAKEAVRLFDDGVLVTTVDALPPEEKKPEPPPPPKPQNTAVKQQRFINQIVIVDKDVQTQLPTVDALPDAVISDITTTGEGVGVMQPSVAPLINSVESSLNAAEDEPKKEVVPDKQPQFPGGVQAWMAFLSGHLRAPQELEPGEKRTVMIRFFVAEDGLVTNFEVLQSAGAAFDHEVIRVLKKMPKWTPATQKGQAVSVSFTQPVTFVGVEE
jgi:protein TonB